MEEATACKACQIQKQMLEATQNCDWKEPDLPRLGCCLQLFVASGLKENNDGAEPWAGAEEELSTTQTGMFGVRNRTVVLSVLHFVGGKGMLAAL